MSELVRAREWPLRTGDLYFTGVMRIALGALHVWTTVTAIRAYEITGYYGERFHMPDIPDALVPSDAVYRGLLFARLIMGLVVMFGVRARPLLAMLAGLTLWSLLADRIEFHHNRFSLACYSLLFALVPSDRSHRIARPALATGPLPTWPLTIIRMQFALTYVASGGSKLLDPLWSASIGDRIAHYVAEQSNPHALLKIAAEPIVGLVLAKAAIVTELSLALLLFVPRTRALAMWVGVMFHLGIELFLRVEIFSYLAITMLIAFTTPDRGARKIHAPGESTARKRIGWLLRYLDWLGRFELADATDAPDSADTSLAVVDRDGTTRRRLGAFAAIFRGIPVLFPLWIPTEIAARLERRTATS